MKKQCIFCKKDLSKEKYNKDYILLAWNNDPENPKSLNKVAELACIKCFTDFIEMNFQAYKEAYKELL